MVHKFLAKINLGPKKFGVVAVARLDDFRTRKSSNLDDFRAPNASNLFRILIAFRIRKSSNLDEFRALKSSNRILSLYDEKYLTYHLFMLFFSKNKEFQE